VPSVLDGVADFAYNTASKRFKHSETGRFLSEQQAIALIDGSIIRNKENLQSLAANLSSGKIDLVDFVTQSSQSIKDLHILNAVKALDGRGDRISADQLKVITDRVKSQLSGGKNPITGDRFGVKYLVRDIVKGDLSEAQLKNRLRMYANSGDLTQKHVEASSKKEEGMTEGLRLLSPTDSHCQECVDLSGLGWVSLSALVIPGDQCSCRSNCKCAIEYR